MGGHTIYRIVFSKMAVQQKPKNSEDMVILHQPCRFRTAPSLSPFVIKFETYLRMAEIPYKCEFGGSGKSPKGKIPWMEYKGARMGDSQLCIEHLNRDRNLNLDSDLGGDQVAAARAFRKMLEESTYWGMLWFLLVYSPRQTKVELFGSKFKGYLVHYLAGPRFKRTLHTLGFGRHSDQEKLDFIRGDLRALSLFLDSKKYFMGDEASEVDAAIFGQLACLLWIGIGSPMEVSISGEFSNLKEYCERMRGRYWPDWDDCCANAGGEKGGTK